MSDTALPEWLTDEEAGKLMRRSAQTVARWRKFQGLPFRPGRPALIELTDLLDFVEQNKTRTFFPGAVFGKHFVPGRPTPAPIPAPTPEELAQQERRKRVVLKNTITTRRNLRRGRV